MYVNQFTFCGYLVADPEAFEFKGSPGSRFTVALNKPNLKRPIYVKCVAWRNHASLINEYCRKGQEIHISGEVDIKSYTDSQGIRRKDFSVTVREFSAGQRATTPTAEATLPKPRVLEDLPEEGNLDKSYR